MLLGGMEKGIQERNCNFKWDSQQEPHADLKTSVKIIRPVTKIICGKTMPEERKINAEILGIVGGHA